MKTKEQFFREEREERKRKSIERRVKWRNEILEEIFTWTYRKLQEEYVKVRLARISYHSPISAGMAWDIFKNECRFCDLEYIYGHENCCDDCWDKNKSKTLEELE